MALVLTLTLAPGPVVSGQPKVAMLKIANNGGTDVLVSAIQTYSAPAATSGYVAQPQFPPGSSMVVPATSGVLNVPFSFVCDAPVIAGATASPSAIFQLAAVVYSNDATAPVQAAPPLTIAMTPELVWTQAQNPTSPGWLDFTQPANTGLLALGIY